MRRNTEVMGWGSWVAIVVAVVVLLSAIGLTVYGGRVTPVQHPVELIIPNDRLPN
jgi:CHASE1-domain containing sensor protein